MMGLVCRFVHCLELVSCCHGKQGCHILTVHYKDAAHITLILVGSPHAALLKIKQEIMCIICGHAQWHTDTAFIFATFCWLHSYQSCSHRDTFTRHGPNSVKTQQPFDQYQMSFVSSQDIVAKMVMSDHILYIICT